MRISDFLKKMVRDYFIIFAVIVICMTILRRIFSPGTVFEIKDMFIYMICALAGDLPSLILYKPNDMSEKEMGFRIILHFIALEAILLIIANMTGWIAGMLNTVILALQIAVIYLLIRLLNWLYDRKSVDKINERLKRMRDEMNR